MKHIFILTAICFGFLTKSMTQDTTSNSMAFKPKQNAFYVEMAGESIYGATMNYERFFSKKPGGLSARVGIGLGFLADFNETSTYWAAPAGLSYNFGFGSKTDFLEVGANLCVLGSTDGSGTIVNPVIGWRHMSKNNFHARVTFMPAVFFLGENLAVPWGGVSLGFSF